MKVSVCITVFNEEESIEKLLQSLVNQSKEPDDIVIVDASSTDRTVELINNFKDKQKFKHINLIVRKCSRAEGRNISVREAKYDIIAMTDADCVAKKNWFRNITEPFTDTSIDIVAGFYNMVGDSAFQKAEAVFLGVMPTDFDNKSFLPSTRSIAFRRSAWESIGGFPEKGNNSAEDTDFNYLAIKKGLKFARVKSARVEWRIPSTMTEYYKKVYAYAKWDAKYGVLWDSEKGMTSHNIKTLLKLFRYALGLSLLLLGLTFQKTFLYLLFFLVLLYSFYSFYKVCTKTKDIRAGLWGIVLQYTSDITGIGGLLLGLVQK